MPNIIWALTWRIYIVMSYPLLIAMRNANAKTEVLIEDSPIVVDVLEQIAQSHTTSLIIGACIVFWLMGSIIGALYPTPDDLKSIEISIGLRLLICLAGGLGAFLWVLNGDGALNLLTPLWVGGVAFVAPHLIQLVQPAIKTKFGFGGKS